jgi:catechol 2,3-dioxygenase-like lactoylglutathione lyase family enzyme
MLHHVSVGVSDVERAAKFYDAVLGTLGYKRVMEFMPYAVAYGETSPSFWIQLPHNQQSPSVGNGAHVGFSARSKLAVDAFHHSALAKGGLDNGAPGPRPDYGPDYYGAFIIDLDGNKIEATLHAEPTKARAASAPKAKAKRAKKTAAKRKAKPAAAKPAKAKRAAKAKQAAKPARRKAKRR